MCTMFVNMYTSLPAYMVTPYTGNLAQCLQVPSGIAINVHLEACGAAGGVWSNPLINGNFDNIGAASLFLFELMTGMTCHIFGVKG